MSEEAEALFEIANMLDKIDTRLLDITEELRRR